MLLLLITAVRSWFIVCSLIQWLIRATLPVGLPRPKGQISVAINTDVLKQAAQASGFPKPHNIEVHVGAEDWQAGPQALVEFCKAVGIEVHVVPGRGHMLGSDCVGPLLDDWLPAN